MAFPLSSSPQTLVTACISVPGPSLMKCKRAALLSRSAPSRASCCPRLSLPGGLGAPRAAPGPPPREQEAETCMFPCHLYVAESLDKFLAK